MRNNMLIVIILFIMMFSVCCMSTVCYANADELKNFREQDQKITEEYNNKITGNGSGNFDPNDYKPDSTTDVKNGNELAKAGSKMMGALMSVASVLAVTTFSILGIKYMLGSVEEKAQYKKTLFPYLIGAIMVFGITTVIQIISAIANNMPS